VPLQDWKRFDLKFFWQIPSASPLRVQAEDRKAGFLIRILYHFELNQTTKRIQNGVIHEIQLQQWFQSEFYRSSLEEYDS